MHKLKTGKSTSGIRMLVYRHNKVAKKNEKTFVRLVTDEDHAEADPFVGCWATQACCSSSAADGRAS